MLHSGCVKLHQKFLDFVGLPMGLLREESPKTRMNTGLFGPRIGEYGLSREEAAIAVSEGKKRIDPFYSKNNIRYLEGIVKDVKDGTAHFSEHDLIEE